MKRALVTGGSRGIGKAVCKLLSDSGCTVLAPPRSELDLLDRQSIESFLNVHLDDHFDILINNAGINDINDIENITDVEIDKTLQTNLIAPILLARGLVPSMKASNYGRIVNIGSIWSIVSKRGRLTYSATKHGIHGVTKTLAVELAPYNILVNTICPGFTLTELTAKNNSPKEIEIISEDIPLGRMAQPEEIARAICWFASEENTYATGQLIAIDGGYTSK